MKLKWQSNAPSLELTVPVGRYLPYELPIASKEELGGVKIDGDTITITEDGVISSKQTALSGVATQEELDQVKASIAEKVDVPQTASVGDVLTVEEIDANGKPTKWKAAMKKQPNWEQNDSAAEDYIQNRPAMYSERVEKTISDIYDDILEGFDQTFELGKQINIQVNGKDYSLDVKYDSEYNQFYIGDISSDEVEFGWGVSTDASGVYPEYWFYSTNDELYTVKYAAIEFRTIDKAYIPPMLKLRTDNFNTVINPSISLAAWDFENLGIYFSEEDNSFIMGNKNYAFLQTRLATGATMYKLDTTLNKTVSYSITADAYKFDDSSKLGLSTNLLRLKFYNGKSGDERTIYYVLLCSLATKYNSSTSQTTYIYRGTLTTETEYTYEIVLTINFKDENVTENKWLLEVTRVK